MAETLFGVSLSQSSLLLHQPKIGLSLRRPTVCSISGRAPTIATGFSPSNRNRLCAAIVSDTKASSSFTVADSANKGTDLEFDNGGSTGGGLGDDSGGGSGGGGGGGGDDNGGGGGGNGEDESRGDSEKKMGMSMSQKLTLGYAALVGVGGLMGYLKSGSQKSLLAGGSSAALLYYIHTQLPTNPVFASALGLGISAALLVVMGSRFKRSGKIFPAGVVSLVSLVMTGGYLHGILRTAH